MLIEICKSNNKDLMFSLLSGCLKIHYDHSYTDKITYLGHLFGSSLKMCCALDWPGTANSPNWWFMIIFTLFFIILKKFII